MSGEIKAKKQTSNLPSGWSFKVEEISNGAYQVEGKDQFGRIVSHTGGDPEALLEKCMFEAKQIQAKGKAT